MPGYFYHPDYVSVVALFRFLLTVPACCSGSCLLFLLPVPASVILYITVN